MIIDKVKEAISKYGLLQKRDKVIVGVSGGPDSVTLLYLLNSLKDKLKIELHIAHLDHMLRRDSHKDAAFVQGLSRKLGLPITCSRIDVRKLSRKGSIEEIARNARLDFFFRTARMVGAKKIALGHNLDDQAETVLMRILRGAGLYGLSGILPRRSISGFTIIRPLIAVRRREIEAFLKSKKLKERRDPSNSEDIYFRNRLRNRLLPMLEKEYNRNIKEVLSNIAETSAYDYEYLARAAERSLGKTRARMDLKKILRLHPALRRLTLRLMIGRVKGDTRRLTLQHTREIEDLIFTRPLNSIVDLPKGVSVKKQRKFLSFYLR